MHSGEHTCVWGKRRGGSAIPEPLAREYRDAVEYYAERWEALQKEVGDWYQASLAAGVIKWKKGERKAI